MWEIITSYEMKLLTCLKLIKEILVITTMLHLTGKKMLKFLGLWRLV